MHYDITQLYFLLYCQLHANDNTEKITPQPTSAAKALPRKPFSIIAVAKFQKKKQKTDEMENSFLVYMPPNVFTS